MRRLGIAVLVVVGLVVGASCTYKDEVPGNLETKAGEMIDKLADHEWDDVREEFDDDLRDLISEKRLEDTWNDVVDDEGAYQTRGEPKRVRPATAQTKKDILFFDVPLQFGRGGKKARISFHRDGKIASLSIAAA
ncbi:MAG TPA: DUF3887 domain-containing protein [Acidimicrobiales bacterium]|nr:DUF3887 domain-containing protein [Acidimicrobiales bacterium]